MTLMGANAIGRLTKDGQYTQYRLTFLPATPLGITAARDGSVWFTEYSARAIGRLTPQGVLTEWALPSDGDWAAFTPNLMTSGPDGNIWFTVASTGTCVVGRIMP
jgi:virginiamycin B lyase